MSIQNNGQLQEAVEKISLHFFGRPFLHVATFNGRLKTTGGRYHMGSHNLDFNPKVLSKYGIDELIGVIKHELCHYHLHLAGKGYQHKDRDFKELLQRTQGSRYVRSLIDQEQMHTYQCQDCEILIHRKRRINLNRYVCGNCRGELRPVNESNLAEIQ